MAIQGHSFGGFETNFIATNTDMFAAVVSSAGVCDNVSWYNSTMRRGVSLQYMSEIGQARIGSSLWNSPELYIKNSPIYYANKVSSPLLMFHNKADGIVPFTQGVEFFSALRRLGKRAWMLQYDGEPHSLSDDQNRVDYTIRITQFFDHYLKDAPAPKWMIEGIPAKMKGIDNGLELVEKKDTNGNWITPPEGGLLTDEERRKVDALKHRGSITITIE